MLRPLNLRRKLFRFFFRLFWCSVFVVVFFVCSFRFFCGGSPITKETQAGAPGGRLCVSYGRRARRRPWGEGGGVKAPQGSRRRARSFSGPLWLSSIRPIHHPLLPEYLRNVTAVILDEYTRIILAITALIWKHVLYGKLVFSFFSNPGFRGVMGAIALSEHAWLNEEIDFVNEKCNRWWL